MTQLGVLSPNTNPMSSGSRRFSQMLTGRGNNLAASTNRVLGMWVPAECFVVGTKIEFSIGVTTSGATPRLGIGGDASAVGLGVLSPNVTGPAVTGWAGRATMCQISEGCIVSFESTFEYLTNSTTVANSVGAGSVVAVFIQPLNFVELHFSSSARHAQAWLSVTAGPSAGSKWQQTLSV